MIVVGEGAVFYRAEDYAGEVRIGNYLGFT